MSETHDPRMVSEREAVQRWHNAYDIGQLCEFVPYNSPSTAPRRCVIRLIGTWGNYRYQVEWAPLPGGRFNVLESELTPIPDPGDDASPGGDR